MPNYGWNPGNGSSPRRRVHVLRGFEATNAQALTRTAPAADTYGAGEANEIYSGHAISLNNDGEFTRGQFAAGRTVYIALSNASDTDVQASGLVPGLNCQDNYEIETPWFETGGGISYVADETRLVATLAGTLTPAGTGEDAETIVGKVTRAPYKLNDISTDSAGEGIAVHPFESNELGTTEVLSFVTTQD